MRSVYVIILTMIGVVIISVALTACGQDHDDEKHRNRWRERTQESQAVCNSAVANERNPHKRRDFYDGCLYGFMHGCTPHHCQRN